MAKYEPAHLKRMNTRIIFQEFINRCNESLFVNEIARSSKISVPTVMKIVDFLLEKQLIKEEECTRTQVGRKPNMLKLNREKYFSVGAIYEGEYLTLGIVDLAGKVLNFIQVKCGQRFEESLYLNVDRLLEMSGKSVEDLVGIGIGIPGIFDLEKRELTAPLIGISEPEYFGNVMDSISEKYGVMVIVDNDLNIEAYGAFASLEASEKKDLILISLGTGLGAGIIIDGKVRKGSQSICGEIGYMMFEYSEEQSDSGWLEEKINLKALNKMFGLSDTSNNKEACAEAIEYVSRYLALLINNLIFCYDVPNIVLDGPVIDLLGSRLIEETQKKLNKICYKSLSVKKRNVILPGISGGALLASKAWLEKIFE